nr:oligosaccharide flippase family protein [uncultured Dethiosulfovibrio sp.]
MFTDFFLKGFSIITMPIFTRLLSTSDYGVVALYNTWLSIFSIVITLSLANSLGIAKSDFAERYDQFASSVLFLSLLLFMGFVSVFWLSKEFLTAVTGLSVLLVFLAVFQAYFRFVRTYIIFKLRFEYKANRVSVLTIISTLLGAALSIALILTVSEENRYYGRILGEFLVAGLVSIPCFIFIIKRGKKLVEPNFWKYALCYSSPLVISELSVLINASFDKIVISKYLGNASTGIYSFAYSVGMIASIILASSNLAWTPWFFDKMKSKEFGLIQKASLVYRDLFVLGYVALLFISPEMVRLLADQRYWDGLYLVPWVFMAVYFHFMAFFEIRIQSYEKKTYLNASGTLLSAAVNIVLNLLFVPKYGYPAAAITTAVSYFSFFLFHFIATRKILGINMYGSGFHLRSIAYLAVSTVVFFVLGHLLFVRVLVLLGLTYGVFRVCKKAMALFVQ